MGLQDVTGVFSRYFIVGFFVPTFGSLAFLKLILSEPWVPEAVEPDKSGSFLVIGGAALVFGLVLLGLRDPIVEALSGYFLVRPRTSRLGRLVKGVGDRLAARHVKTFADLEEKAKAFVALRDASEAEREQARRDPEAVRESARAAWSLDRCFPRTATKVLPTYLGNRLRAADDYARSRWSLETVTLRPRIESLLSEQEVKIHADADTDLAFFVNSSLLAAVAGVIAAVDAAVNQPHPAALAWVYILPFLVAMVLYRAAVSAAERRGALLRASIDLHRFELYEKLGVRWPSSYAEQDRMGRAVNQLLLYGWSLADDLLAQPIEEAPGDGEPDGPAGTGAAEARQEETANEPTLMTTVGGKKIIVSIEDAAGEEGGT